LDLLLLLLSFLVIFLKPVNLSKLLRLKKVCFQLLVVESSTISPFLSKFCGFPVIEANQNSTCIGDLDSTDLNSSETVEIASDIILGNSKREALDMQTQILH